VQNGHNISVLRAEQNVLQRSLLQTQAYVAPIHRLPGELLSEDFMAAWDDNPCITWALAGVSRGWRNTALAMPRIWFKVRAATSLSSLFLYRAFASLIADHADSTNHDSSRIAGHRPSLDLAHGLHNPARCRDLPPESEPELGIIIINVARELPAITPPRRCTRSPYRCRSPAPAPPAQVKVSPDLNLRPSGFTSLNTQWDALTPVCNLSFVNTFRTHVFLLQHGIVNSARVSCRFYHSRGAWCISCR
jgi:hypothetical protein